MFLELCVVFFLIQSSFQAQPNILLIVVDDLRPNLGVYGYKTAFTPNIDRLAKKSIVFNNAYAQQALCAPSRNSFLTSRRPDSLHLYDFYSYWRTEVGNFTTLPQYFKENGYFTHSIGKVFHPGISSNWTDDFEYSWSDFPYHPPTEIYKNDKVCRTKDGNLARNLICPVVVEEQPGNSLPDLESATAALDFLQNNKNFPYFLAVGFHKPHIPLKFPIDYLNFHPLSNITLPPIRQKPYNLPSVAWNPWNDLRRRDDISVLNISFPFGVMPDDVIKKIIQSYDSSISYIDDLIGQLIETVDKNTIILLTADHGWNLGENGEFSKFNNFENVVRVPLIIHIPNLTKKQFRTKSLVELVDLFPTLVELCQIGTGIPKCGKKSTKTQLCTEGRSLVPLIVSLVQNKSLCGKEAIFHQYPRPGLFPTKNPDSDRPKLKNIKIMGYSIRTNQFRYTEWVKFDNKLFLPNWNKVYDRQLYDLDLDPNENMNLASNSELNGVMKELSRKLKLGWRYIK